MGTTNPIPTASVVVAKVGGVLEDYRAGLTDEAGRFAFTDLTAGTYRVYATRTGYLRSEYGRRTGATATFGAGTRITIDDKLPRADITLSMIPFGLITGRVRDSEGKPARNVWVRALRANYQNGERQLDVVEFAKTNDLGEYRVFDLPPGQYFVSATLDRPRIDGDSYVAPAAPIQISDSDRGYRLQVSTPAAKALAEGLIGASAFDQRVFFPTYYPNTRKASDAVSVEVRAGATLPLADLIIVATPTVHVRGRIVNGVTGEPAPNTPITISPLQSVRSGATGSFDIPGVPPGRFELWSSAYPIALQGSAQIEVADRDVEDVTLILRPGLTVTGRMTIDGSTPGKNAARFSVQLLSPPGRGGLSAVAVQPDGSFSIANAGAGDYAFRVLGRDFFVKDAKFGAADVTNSPLHIEPDGAPQFMINVSLNTGTVEARVLNSKQQPVPDTPVVLVPEPPRRNRSELYLLAVSDASGRIRLRDVAPGDYKIFASQDIEPQSWQDPSVLSAYESLGVQVHMIEKAKQEMTVRLISRP